jgi:hypothetical protein
MRGRRLRETEIAAQQCHLPLHFARAQSPATGSDEKRTLSGQLEGAGGEIIGNRLAHRRQDREQALFASLAGNRQHFAQRSLGASWTGERRLQWVRRKPPGSGSTGCEKSRGRIEFGVSVHVPQIYGGQCFASHYACERVAQSLRQAARLRATISTGIAHGSEVQKRKEAAHRAASNRLSEPLPIVGVAPGRCIHRGTDRHQNARQNPRALALGEARRQ